MKKIIKFISCSLFSALMLMLAICFENIIWRVGIVAFTYLFSFFVFVLLKNRKKKRRDYYSIRV